MSRKKRQKRFELLGFLCRASAVVGMTAFIFVLADNPLRADFVTSYKSPSDKLFLPPLVVTLEEELDAYRASHPQMMPTATRVQRGNIISVSEIQSQVTGHTLRLNLLGSGHYQGENGAINSEIKLNADGTADISVTHRFFQTYHEKYSSTRSETAKGRWWINGNSLCMQSKAINNNTKDCYDMSMEGPTLHLYYAPCTGESSMLCKSGRKAGTGRIE
ncbi:MAG: hypothetical protein Q7T44_01505 [Parvibaculum sp.]|nr:hypothetical protein [Parvibaculum sp.]